MAPMSPLNSPTFFVWTCIVYVLKATRATPIRRIKWRLRERNSSNDTNTVFGYREGSGRHRGFKTWCLSLRSVKSCVKADSIQSPCVLCLKVQLVSFPFLPPEWTWSASSREQLVRVFLSFLGAWLSPPRRQREYLEQLSAESTM
jgi:hypothetical protein